MHTRRFNLPFTPRTSLIRLPLAISLAVAGVQVYAQDGRAQLVETVVVVGSTTNTVITPEALEKYQANDLADIFRHVPSVTVGGSLGIAQKVYIRGLEDTLINVTVDGAPQTGTLFHHIGRVSIEPELLKEVEVQAGAGEATSGAGAIGGAIRFRTKDASDLLDSGQQFGGMVRGGYFSNDGYKSSVSLFGNITDNWGLLGSYVYVDNDNMEDGDGDEIPGTSSEQSLAFIKASGKLTDTQSLSISFEQREEEGEFNQRPNWPATEDAMLYPIETERQTYVVNHRINSSDFLNLETTLYYTQAELEQDVFNRWGLYGATITTYGFDVRNTSRLGRHSITYGVDYRDDISESEYLSPTSVWQGWAWDADIGQFKEEGAISGAYIQDHWQLTEQLLLSFGVRYDDYELDQVTYDDGTDSSGFNPNIGLAYSFTPEWKLTVGYAEAMRGKEVGDAFTLEHAPNRLSLQPGLEAEQVENSEIGIEYNDGRLMAKATVYRSEINEVILDQLGSAGPPQDGTYYENVGELETEGFELVAAYSWNAVSIFASYAENDAELNGETVEGYEHNGLANARGDTWNLGLVYTVSPSLEMGWNYTYVEDLDNIEVLHRSVEIGWITETQIVDKPGYEVHDIYIQWQPLNTDTLTINLAVYNLFDKHYRDHSSVADYNHITGWEGVAGLYEPGRDVRLTIGYNF